MNNPFNNESYDPERDLALLAKIREGDRRALSELIQNHQGYVYNVALKFFNHLADAEDATQEVLIKIISHLGSYDPQRAGFRTWLYRITFNHFLNTRKKDHELRYAIGFEKLFDIVNEAPDQELSEAEEADMRLEIEESKVACMAGMIMCLDREQRLIYIVGEVFEIDHQLGADIFQITPDNFRQQLSRARKDLYQWMHRRCGLVNLENPCRCPKKTKSFIERGYVNPESLKWHSDYKQRIFQLSKERIDEVLIERDRIYSVLFRQHPFKDPKEDAQAILEVIIQNEKFGKTFGLS